MGFWLDCGIYGLPVIEEAVFASAEVSAPARGGQALDIVSNRCNFLAPRTAIGVFKASKIVSNTSRFGGLEHPYRGVGTAGGGKKVGDVQKYVYLRPRIFLPRGQKMSFSHCLCLSYAIFVVQ